MAKSLQSVKSESEYISKLFPKSHSRLRVVNYTADEICFHFVGKSDEKFVLNCNISEISEPVQPMWYSESDNQFVTETLESLSEMTLKPRNMIQQGVEYILKELCKKFGVKIPGEVEKLTFDIDITDMDINNNTDEDSSDEELEDMDALGLDVHVVSEAERKKMEDSGIADSDLVKLEKIKSNQQKAYITGSVTGSVQASDRILKDLRAIYKSDSFKNKHYTVELIDDSLYEWNVHILQIDRDSTLYSDLKKLKDKGSDGSIVLQVTFKDNYPFDPPFVRVVKPVLHGGYVFGGGAICMELLTKQGWSSAYSVESLIMQIIATLSKGRTRINFGARPDAFSYARAVLSFQKLVQIHEQNGWSTPPKADG
ncbi:ubiquitin-conjugating enzyme E2 Q2-like [Styela clava]|uniref:ubiquitin-conjugating enzyme E2 Q2-like n=1 Tax=Styela clava TaxID=7725 RepID=UPI00193A46EC|nr:ubiquitin-conjugating enzyme E2 Q2-like [Styela clava]